MALILKHPYGETHIDLDVNCTIHVTHSRIHYINEKLLFYWIAKYSFISTIQFESQQEEHLRRETPIEKHIQDILLGSNIKTQLSFHTASYNNSE